MPQRRLSRFGVGRLRRVAQVTVHRLVLFVAGGCLTLLTLMLLVMPSAAMGRVLVDVQGHGLHQGDVPVLGIWAVGVGALACGWRRA